MRQFPLKRVDLFYVGIPKNSLTTHKMFFREIGWEMSSWHEIFEEAPVHQWSFFGHIQNPHTRHTKGLAEHIYRLWDWRSKSQGHKNLLKFFLQKLRSGLKMRKMDLQYH